MNTHKDNYDQKLISLKKQSGKVLSRKHKVDESKNFLKEHAPKKREFIDKHHHLVPHGDKEEIDLLNGVLSQMDQDVEKFNRLVQSYSIELCDTFDYQNAYQMFHDGLKEAERIINKIKFRKEERERQERLQKEKEEKEAKEKAE